MRPTPTPSTGRGSSCSRGSETAREELFCETIALPQMRVDEDGKRVVASTGEPLPPKHVVVDTSTPCSYY